MTKIVGKGQPGQVRLQRLWRPPAPARSAMHSIAGGALRAAMWAGSHCGQATVEYAIVTGVLIALVLIMGLFLTTFGGYGDRLLAIIASDYP